MVQTVFLVFPGAKYSPNCICGLERFVFCMPLQQVGVIDHNSDIDQETEKGIRELFPILDRKVADIARARRLSRSSVRLLQPLHNCVFVGNAHLIFVLSIHVLGGITYERFVDWTDRPLSGELAVRLVERDLGFEDIFAIQISRAVLDLGNTQKEAAITSVVERYIEDEIVNAERQKRIVRLNPIFQGRDFLVDEQLVFVLSPFGEPFDSIYQDHIKESVESVVGLKCLRANDIYDNLPIVEDIWKYTNEARIVVAELTGRNPNVFYETGIAHTIGKEVILITQSMDDVPFDLRYLRCIVYDFTPRGMTTLEGNLKNTISTILDRNR